MTERRRTEGFEGRLEEAVWSYSGEGVRTFDPVVISGRARSGRAGVLGWDGPAIGDRRVLRFVLVAALMASAALAIALAGAWRTEVPRSLSGVIVVGAGDQFSTIDMGSSTVRPLTR